MLNRNIIRWLIVLASLCASFAVMFAITTIYAQREHENQLSATAKLAENAQREANGTQAMIFAVCKAFHRRDEALALASMSDANKWALVTNIENKYPTPNKNSVDAEYHRERREALSKATIKDKELIANAQKVLNFDCVKGMERAYFEGAKSSSAPLDSRHTHN